MRNSAGEHSVTLVVRCLTLVLFLFTFAISLYPAVTGKFQPGIPFVSRYAKAQARSPEFWRRLSRAELVMATGGLLMYGLAPLLAPVMDIVVRFLALPPFIIATIVFLRVLREERRLKEAAPRADGRIDGR